MERGESISQSFMLLCFVAAGLLASVQFYSRGGKPDIAQTTAPPASFVAEAPPASRPLETVPRPLDPQPPEDRVDATDSPLQTPAQNPDSEGNPQRAATASTPPASETPRLTQPAIATPPPMRSPATTASPAEPARPPAIQAAAVIDHLVASPVHSVWATLNPLVQEAVAPIAALDDAYVVIDLSDRYVYTYAAGTLQNRYPIAVGKAGWETPVGEFTVIEKRLNPPWQHPITREIISTGADNPLGTRWIGFWSQGPSKIGFHGTNQSNLIGQAVSHGCIRMHNDDIEALYDRVDLGTTVIVQP